LRALQEASLQVPPSNVVMIPTGPKTHALAMGLYALISERTTVLYRNPEGFFNGNSEPTGRVWITGIRDASLATR